MQCLILLSLPTVITCMSKPPAYARRDRSKCTWRSYSCSHLSSFIMIWGSDWRYTSVLWLMQWTAVLLWPLQDVEWMVWHCCPTWERPGYYVSIKWVCLSCTAPMFLMFFPLILQSKLSPIVLVKPAIFCFIRLGRSQECYSTQDQSWSQNRSHSLRPVSNFLKVSVSSRNRIHFDPVLSQSRT